MKKRVLFYFLLFLAFGNITAQIGYNVEVLPSNVGGKAEFKRVFEQEVMFPSELLVGQVDETVTINFEIHKDSSIANVKTNENARPEMAKEALRLFNMLLWVPAMKEGQFVGAKWSVEYVFDHSKYAKICKQRGYKKMKYIEGEKIDSSGIIYTTGVQMPIYEKGNFALQDFIKDNLEYPRQAQLSNLQGTVILSFVVEPSGLMTNIGVQKSVGGGCDQEAIRVLELIKWYPGKYDDKLARVKMTFPVYFILNEEFKDNASGEQK